MSERTAVTIFFAALIVWCICLTTLAVSTHLELRRLQGTSIAVSERAHLCYQVEGTKGVFFCKALTHKQKQTQ